jgi:hypothetical protein
MDEEGGMRCGSVSMSLGMCFAQVWMEKGGCVELHLSGYQPCKVLWVKDGSAGGGLSSESRKFCFL